MSGTRCDHVAAGLLPWYANGSLEGREAAEVRAHVESCRSCAAQLDELFALGRLIEQEGVPLLSEARGDEGAARPTVRPWLAYSGAAALALPAALGIWWSLLGFPGVDRDSPRRRPPAAPEALPPGSGKSPGAEMGRSALLDLEGGSPRGPRAGKVFHPPAAADTIQIVFSIPVNLDARYRIVLRGPAGETLSREDDRLPLDFDGSARYTIPALLLREPGPYLLVVIETPAGQPRREFHFPFEIESPASARGRP